MDGMKNNQEVIVTLAGEEHFQHRGVVINAKKQWVEIPNYLDRGKSFIADESNITSWSAIGK